MTGRGDQIAMGKTAAHIIVEGVVQGVFFRRFIQTSAESLELHGWVRNLADGRVELLAEGDSVDIETLMKKCWIGPPHANVSNVLKQECDPQGFENFEIRSSALEPVRHQRKN